MFLRANPENVIQVLSLLNLFQTNLWVGNSTSLAKTMGITTFQLIYYSIFAMCHVFSPIPSFRRLKNFCSVGILLYRLAVGDENEKVMINFATSQVLDGMFDSKF